MGHQRRHNRSRMVLSAGPATRSEEHTSELQSHVNLVCRLLLEKKKYWNLPQALEPTPSDLPAPTTLASPLLARGSSHSATATTDTDLPSDLHLQPLPCLALHR